MGENADILRRIGDALNAGEVPDCISPDCRLENAATAVTDGIYVGHHGVRDWRRDLFQAFAEGARLQAEEILAEGEDYAVAVTSITGRGATSDAPLELRWVTAYSFSDGQMTRATSYLRKRDALAAVGLVR